MKYLFIIIFILIADQCGAQAIQVLEKNKCTKIEELESPTYMGTISPTQHLIWYTINGFGHAEAIVTTTKDWGSVKEDEHGRMVGIKIKWSGKTAKETGKSGNIMNRDVFEECE